MKRFSTAKLGGIFAATRRGYSHSEKVQEDLLTIVNGQENKLVYVRSISKFYESCFHRKFPYVLSLLNEALESLDRPLEVW